MGGLSLVCTRVGDRTILEDIVLKLKPDMKVLKDPRRADFNQAGRVTTIDFGYLDLLQVPTLREFRYLTGLITLVLNSKQPKRPIPTEFGDLTNLKMLSIGWAQLTGTVPIEIGHLTSLNGIELYINYLTGQISTELGQLTSLKRPYLRDN